MYSLAAARAYTPGDLQTVMPRGAGNNPAAASLGQNWGSRVTVPVWGVLVVVAVLLYLERRRIKRAL